MSLLQNEEFVLYQLRTAFLTHNRDTYPERLINVNTSVLNDPAFRAAGWAPNVSEIKRTYSPPIPTVVTSEYFRAPTSADLEAPAGFGDDEEEGGMVTGGGGSNDTVGPTRDVRRRRRRDRVEEEEDSSDLSDDSDEADEPTAVQQLKFNKMPVRNRAGSSPPVQESKNNGPAVMVTSPSKPPGNDHLKRGDSISTVETIRGRPRRDTATSSELSSENEVEQSLFRKRTINGQQAASVGKMLTLRIQEAEREDDDEEEEQEEAVDGGADSDDSGSLTSEFSGTADSTSILGEVGTGLTSPLDSRLAIPQLPTRTPRESSPKKSRQPPPVLQALPPPRPISIIQPSSLLSMALKVKNKKPESPFERFATLSGKGDPNPFYIKLYMPHCESMKVSELLIRRTTDRGEPITVSEAIGLALYRYGEDNLDPPIDASKMNVNCWNFRMVEDEEIEYDFPAVTRTKPMTDFTSNNNRPQRGRARDKPWDEFALVEASEREFQDNERQTPVYSREVKAAQEASEVAASAPSIPIKSEHPSPAPTPAPRNPIMGPTFTATTIPRKDNPLDAPVGPVSHAVPRTGPPKTITVHFTDDNFLTRTTAIEVTTDTYIAEVFDQVCKKLNVDKAMFVLKVHGSATVAPTDRTVEALADRSELDLVRRRFMGAGGIGGIGLAGSPGSGSPNAPLIIATGGTTTKKGGKVGKQVVIGPTTLNPLAGRNEAFLSANNFKRYQVIRKQPMSFSSSSSRVLALDGEYLHIMPSQEGHGAGGKGLLEAPGKTTTVHYSSVVGCKASRRHPRMLSVHVYKEKETKRYDFEARSQAEAGEIVREIKRGVERFQEGVL